MARQHIVGFHQDDELHWVAELQCGHAQHVRHNPPWQNRHWVVSQKGRLDAVGKTLDCLKCDRAEPFDGQFYENES